MAARKEPFLWTGCRLASDRHLMRVVALVMATGSLKKHHSIPVKGQRKMGGKNNKVLYIGYK